VLTYIPIARYLGAAGYRQSINFLDQWAISAFDPDPGPELHAFGPILADTAFYQSCLRFWCPVCCWRSRLPVPFFFWTTSPS